MNNQNKNPLWITIPEKEISKKKIFSDKKDVLNPDKVNNKVFWGAGFAALAVFSFMLIMPGKLSELFQGDLFDGEFQVIPDAEDQQGGAFFGGEVEDSTETETEDEASNENQTVTQPTNTSTSDAVPVQVDPIQTNTTEPNSENTQEEAPLEETLPIEEPEEVSSELQLLLENLTAQLDELKQDGLEKDKEIQALSDMLEQQAIHEAAKPTPEPVTEVVQNTPQPQVQNTQNSTYRPNTHTVQLSPQQILANNTNKNQMQSQGLQANVTQGAPNGQNLNTALSGVNSQPTTGPMESLMMAFLLSCFAVLGFGVYRTVKN